MSKKTQQQEKWMQYAAIISSQINDMFQPESENHIDLKDLSEGDNVKHFFHALATVVPGMLFNKLTKDDKNNLEFNHVANHLVFEFSTQHP